MVLEMIILRKIISIVLITIFVLLAAINSPAIAEPVTDLDHGAALFKANCAGCHANGGNIVRRGRNLKLKTLHKNKVDTQAAIAAIVTNGKNNMSAYQDKLTTQEIADVSAYVLRQAELNWK